MWKWLPNVCLRLRLQDLDGLQAQLEEVRFFDLFGYSEEEGGWLCFMCNNPEKATGNTHTHRHTRSHAIHVGLALRIDLAKWRWRSLFGGSQVICMLIWWMDTSLKREFTAWALSRDSAHSPEWTWLVWSGFTPEKCDFFTWYGDYPTSAGGWEPLAELNTMVF